MKDDKCCCINIDKSISTILHFLPHSIIIMTVFCSRWMTSCPELLLSTWPWGSGTTWCSYSSSSPPSTRPAQHPAQDRVQGAPGDRSPPSNSRALVPHRTPLLPHPHPPRPPQTPPPPPQCLTQRRCGCRSWVLVASTLPRLQPALPPAPPTYPWPDPCLRPSTEITTQTKPRHQTNQMPSVGSLGAAGTAGQQQPGGRQHHKQRGQRVAGGSRRPRNQS